MTQSNWPASGMWFAVHFSLVVALAYDVGNSGLFHPVALAYLLWCFLALGLLAVRSVALPVGIAQSLWISFCALAGIVGYVHAAFWSGGEGNGIDDVLALSHLSPVLGYLQAVFLVLVPLVLFRTLVREHKSVA